MGDRIMVNLVVLYAIYPGSNPGLPTNLCALSSTVLRATLIR